MEEKNYLLESSSKASYMDKLKNATFKFVDRRFDPEDIIELFDDAIAFVAEDEVHVVAIMEGFDTKTPTRKQFEALLLKLVMTGEVPADRPIIMDCAMYHIIDSESSAVLRYIENCREFGCVIDDDPRC